MKTFHIRFGDIFELFCEDPSPQPRSTARQPDAVIKNILRPSMRHFSARRLASKSMIPRGTDPEVKSPTLSLPPTHRVIPAHLCARAAYRCRYFRAYRSATDKRERNGTGRNSTRKVRGPNTAARSCEFHPISSRPTDNQLGITLLPRNHATPPRQHTLPMQRA